MNSGVPDISNGWQLAGLVVVVGFQAYQIWMQRQIIAQQTENHLALNSRLSQLVETTKEASHAVGKAEGVAEERETAKAILAKQQEDLHADPPRSTPGIGMRGEP